MGIRRAKSVNMDVIRREVEDLLRLPHSNRGGTGFKIVRAVCQAMTNALQQGETVSISGFGKFIVKYQKPGKCYCFLRPGRSKKKTERHLIDIPEKHYVYFKPSAVLKRMVNEETCQTS